MIIKGRIRRMGIEPVLQIQEKQEREGGKKAQDGSRVD